MKKIWFYCIISLLFFGLLFKMEYATDTYSVFNFDNKEIFSQFAMSGRFITAIVGRIIKVFNLSDKTIYIGSYIIAILCAILSQYILYTIIEKNVESKILKLIIPILIIINPFSIELFMYIEKGIMWFGILMCIFGLKSVIKYFESKKKKYIFFAIIQIFIANCSYQGIVGIFVSISLVYILKYSKDLKQFLINNNIVGLIYIISSLLDFLIMKIIFNTSRINGQIILNSSLRIIIKRTIEMYIKTYNILPKYTFILLILFTFGVFWCKILKEQNKIIQVLKFIYIIIGISFVSIAPQFIQPTNSIWFVPRSTYSFASMYGIIILYITMNYKIEETFIKSIIVVSCLLIIFQVQKFIKIEKDRFIVNKKDKEVTMQIIDQIKTYEIQTNNKIMQICIYYDEKPKYTYDGILAIGDMNIKCYYTDWSTIEILKYYLKRNLELIDKNDDLEQKFKKVNWDEFNIEQIVFKENTINICNY